MSDEWLHYLNILHIILNYYSDKKVMEEGYHSINTVRKETEPAVITDDDLDRSVLNIQSVI